MNLEINPKFQVGNTITMKVQFNPEEFQGSSEGLEGEEEEEEEDIDEQEESGEYISLFCYH